MSLADDLARAHGEHIRLSVLRLLDGLPTYSANDSVLSQAVCSMGLAHTRDQMRGHLEWLEEQRLVTRLRHDNGIVVATLTERGGDVAHGRSLVAGVQRPSPRA